MTQSATCITQRDIDNILIKNNYDKNLIILKHKIPVTTSIELGSSDLSECPELKIKGTIEYLNLTVSNEDIDLVIEQLILKIINWVIECRTDIELRCGKNFEELTYYIEI